MPASYSITEPHPTTHAYMHSGRGGAGNTFKASASKSKSNNTAAAALAGPAVQPHSKFSSGRGGAGNIHLPSERAIFSFDEELDRQASRERNMKDGGLWHVGRGGAGNWTTAQSSAGRKDSTSSADSVNSTRSGFLGRLSHTFEHR